MVFLGFDFGMGDTVPPEVVEQLRKFDEALSSLEDAFQVYFPKQENDMQPLEKIRVDLMCVFVINSLYWMLLCTNGRKPKNNEILQNEIERTKEYMGRMKQVEDRKLAPQLNQRAAKSFIRSALWEPKQGTTSGNINEDEIEGRCEMESEDNTTVSVEEESVEERMDESPVFNNSQKRPSQETDVVSAECIASKRKRL